MGMFDVTVELANLAAPSRTEEISLLVDTGATWSWIPREILQKLGVVPISRLPFTLADGQRLERGTTAVLMTIDGRKGAVQVAFGEPGEKAVLGATSLEGLGFLVDPVARKLVPRDLRQLRAAHFPDPHQMLREEFNRWAEAGRGDAMEQEHLPITLPVLEKMRLAPTDNIFDVGCGAGWLSRRLAKLVPEGRVVGMDISDEMIRHARRASVEFDNLMFITGEVGQIPWQPQFFSHVISVESSYYWPDPAAGVKDIFRVLTDRGSAWILINYYRDNPHCHQWGSLLAVPTHLFSAEEWCGFFREAGFANVAHERVIDRSPSPEVYTGRWFRDAQQLRAFKAEGALLVYGTK
jgi:SAM-dependent methyltransferase/predicted aspartyl protease